MEKGILDRVEEIKNKREAEAELTSSIEKTEKHFAQEKRRTRKKNPWQTTTKS